MWQNNRCSTLFHLLVPGGKWHTLNVRSISSAKLWTATFHARRLQITTPGQLQAMGLDPRQGITVFKVGYLHPELEALGAAHVLLLSDGTSHLDLARLPSRRIRRPAFPFDPAMGWVPAQGGVKATLHVRSDYMCGESLRTSHSGGGFDSTLVAILII